MPPKNLKGLMAKTASARTERVKNIHLDLPVPSWDGDLVMRFTIVDREQIEALGTKQKRTVDDDIDIVMNSLVSLWSFGPENALLASGVSPEECKKLKRMQENTNYFMLEDDENGTPIKLDVRLIDAFYDEEQPDEVLVALKQEPSVRGILLDWLYAGNATALGETTGRLLTWSGNTDRKLSESIVPESRA